MCKILAEKNHLCLYKGVFSAKRLTFAQKCERTFEGSRPGGEGEEVEDTSKIAQCCVWAAKRKRSYGGIRNNTKIYKNGTFVCKRHFFCVILHSQKIPQ